MARAVQIVDYVKVVVQEDPKRKEVALDSQQARLIFKGADGEQGEQKRDYPRHETSREAMARPGLWSQV